MIAALSLLAAGVASAKPVTTTQTGPGYEFEFSYPVEMKRIPKLRDQLEKQKAAALAEIKTLGADWVKDEPERSKEASIEVQTHWKIAANLPDFLSLTADGYSYSGGAHGISGRTSFVWDKKAGKLIDPSDMFVGAPTFDAVLQTRYCDALDIKRSEKRDGEKVDRSKTDDWMQACPAPSNFRLILGSSNRKTFNRMAIYAGPYDVGPYSEGDYEIDLPVTADVIAMVRPQFQKSFSFTPVGK
jgi:Deacetylase PdaC